MRDGDRVCINARGIAQGIRVKHPHVLGTVTGRSKANPGCFNVRWDGTKESDPIHRDFLSAASPTADTTGGSDA